MHPCHQNLITQIDKLGTVMIKYRVQYVEKCNQKQRFWFGFCEKEILSILSIFFLARETDKKRLNNFAKFQFLKDKIHQNTNLTSIPVVVGV